MSENIGHEEAIENLDQILKWLVTAAANDPEFKLPYMSNMFFTIQEVKSYISKLEEANGGPIYSEDWFCHKCDKTHDPEISCEEHLMGEVEYLYGDEM